MTDRLFVPLKTEFYGAFENGSKEYELRGINNQFNPQTVNVGRRVELRRGYSTDDSVWGEITDVCTFDSTEDLIKRLDTKEEPNVGQITPELTIAEFEDQVQDMLGKYDSYICFKVSLRD